MSELYYNDIYKMNSNEVNNHINNIIEELEKEKLKEYITNEEQIFFIDKVIKKLRTTFNVIVDLYETDIEIVTLDNIKYLIDISNELNLPFKLYISGSSYKNINPINNINMLFSHSDIDKFLNINKYLKENGYELRFTEDVSELTNTWSIDEVITANNSVNSLVDFINKHYLSPFEAIAFIHKLTASTFEYQEKEEYGLNSRSLVGILTTDEIVCVGYSTFIKAVCDKLNMNGLECECYTCFLEKDDGSICDELKEMGFKSGVTHMQNLIRITDEKYGVNGAYVLDTCWDSKTPNFPNGKGYAHFLYPVTDLLCFNDIKFIQHDDVLDDVICSILECDDKSETAPIIVNNKTNSLPISIDKLYDCLFNLYKVLYNKYSDDKIIKIINRTLEISKLVSEQVFSSSATNAIRQEALNDDLSILNE